MIAPRMALELESLAGRTDPGPGIGNIHLSTAKKIAQYYADNYSCSSLRLDIQAGDGNAWLGNKLANDQYSVRVIAAYVRYMADYRFGSDGQSIQVNHSNVSKWALQDALALWHGFRFGVPLISPGGQGFRNIDDFQKRNVSSDFLIENIIQGIDAKQSVRNAIPIFKNLGLFERLRDNTLNDYGR